MKFSFGLFTLIAAANILSAQAVSINASLPTREEQIIAASTVAAAPQFNGARAVGIYLGTPLI